MKQLFLLVWLILLTGVSPGVCTAAETFIFKGMVVDAVDAPVSEAEVFLYRTKNVKKPADFVSSRTGENGYFTVVVPAGRYWAVAALRQGERRFGPLGLGDKHSGEAVEVIIDQDEELERNFVVMDLREAARKALKRSETLLQLSGRIVDQAGQPVELAYAMADTATRFKELPRYISAWTDNSGRYILFLPHGTYYLAASTGFPPDADYILTEAIEMKNDRSGYDIVLPVK